MTHDILRYINILTYLLTYLLLKVAVFTKAEHNTGRGNAESQPHRYQYLRSYLGESTPLTRDESFDATPPAPDVNVLSFDFTQLSSASCITNASGIAGRQVHPKSDERHETALKYIDI